MAVKMSPKIRFKDYEKLKNINPETMKLWNKYKIDMALRELSEKTIAGYTNDFEHYLIFIYDNFDNKCVTEMDEDDITEFLYYCKSNGNNSRRIKRRISTISAFYKYLRKKRIVQENPLEFIDRPKKDTDIITQTFLTQEQVNLMRDKLKECGDLDLYLYAMFSLSTMARVKAVSSVRWEQIDYEMRTANDVPEKEGKIVTLYYSEEVKDLLLQVKAYREEQQIDDNGYIFYSRFDRCTESVTTGTLNSWCKRIGNMIGVPTLHPHDFRHSASQLLKLAGMPIEEISELLNHSGLDVTKKHYLRQDKRKLQASKDMYSI